MSKYSNLVQSELTEKIENYIITQGLAPGDRLPPERRFCDELEVSRMTLRQALGKLEEAGVLVSEAGCGTRVAPRRISKDLLRFPKLGEDAYKLISVVVQEAKGTTARMLRTPAGAEVYLIKRLRLVDGQRVSIESAYVPVAFMGRMDIEYLEILPVHIIYGKKVQDLLTRSDVRVSIGQATFEESEWLGIAEGDYVTIEKHVVYHEATPMEYCISVSDAKKVQYSAHLEQGGEETGDGN